MWRRVAQSLATLALLLLCPAVAHAQSKTRVYDFCAIGGQKVITQGLTQSSPPAVMGSYGTAPISPPCVVTVFETGTLTLATIFQDAGGTPQTNPFSSANTQSYWYFYGTPGDRVDVTISGGGLPASFTFADILIGGAVPTALLLQTNGVTNLSQTSLNLVAGSNITLTNTAGGNVRIDATGGGGGGCSTSTLPDTAVLSNHPIGTCYGSTNFTWNDAASAQNLQAGLSNLIGSGSSLQFQLGSTNSTCTTSGISGCIDFYAFGHNNSLEAASGHATDANLSDIYALGFNNTTANSQAAVLIGGHNTSTADGNITSPNMENILLAGFSNSLVATDVSSAGTNVFGAYALGDGSNFSATGGAQIDTVLCLLEGCNNGPSDGVIATSGGSVNVSILAGKASLISASGAGTNSSSFYSVGEANSQTATSACNAQNNFVYGEDDNIQCQSGLQATSGVLLGFNHFMNAAAASISKVFLLGETDTVAPLTTTTGDVFGIGANLTIRDCTYCFAIGHNLTNTTSNSIALGFSSPAEIVITSGQVKFNAPLVMDPHTIQIVGQSFASLPTCNAGQIGSLGQVTDSTVSTFNATIAGSGSKKVQAYCNGTNWVVLGQDVSAGSPVSTTGSPLNTYLAGFTGASTISGTANATIDTSGNVVVASLTATGLTSGRCVQTTTGGLFTIAAAACGTSSGTITATGSPVSGNLTKFSGATSITNGDLSGDVTTSGTLATTVLALRGLTLPTLAASTGFLYDNAGTLALTTSASNLTTGTLPAAQLPNPSASTLGGVESLAAVSHKWINTISTSGVPSATQPVCADLSDSVASCSTDTTNAANISSGTLPHARLPTLLSGDIPNNAANTSGVAANLSGTPALPNGTTATTQSTADTTTKLATDAFVHNNLPAFQVNGTPNGSQSLVNLAAGSNITITDGGSGTITIASTGGGGGTTPGGAFNTVQFNSSGGFGGVTLNATATKEYLQQVSSGAPTFAQVAAADISGLAASATTDTTNASNISSGTLAHSLLPPLVSGDIPNNAANTSGTAANLSGTPTLPNGTAATTQSASDNSTKLATTAYVTTGIANAIAGVNPAVAVQAATAAILPNSPTYSNGVSGIGATLTAGSLNVTLVVDGYTPLLADRILVKNQAAAAQNGVYTVTQLAAIGLAWVLTRALDYDQPSDINNTGVIPVVNGTANTDTGWILTSAVTTIGTDALTYTQFSLNPSNIVTQTLNATNGQVCTYTGANKVCVPSAALPNGVTATTQSPLDSSTKVATTAYTDAAVTASNVMTTIGDRVGGGVSGVPARVAAGLTGQVDTATNGSTGGFASPGVAGRTVSTSTGDTILGDSGTSLRDRGTTILYTSASPETVTLAQAGTSGFNSNFVFSMFQTGAGAQTITPGSPSTINGQTTLVMTQNSWCTPSSPDNTNYIARCATWIKPGTGLTATYNADTSTTLSLATALPNGTTATKQALGDNTADVASDSFVHDATRAVHMYMTAGAVDAGQSNGTPSALYAFNYVVLTSAVTVTRVGVSAVAGTGCSTTAQFGIYDNGTPNTSSVATLANGANSADSGAISINVSAGHALQLGVVRAASGCAPTFAVETIEYIQQ